VLLSSLSGLRAFRSCPDAVVLIVGNKSDEGDKLKLTAEDGVRQAREWAVNHLMVSAKLGSNVELILPTLLSAKKPAA
jgi:hypothetical protein